VSLLTGLRAPGASRRLAHVDLSGWRPVRGGNECDAAVAMLAAALCGALLSLELRGTDVGDAGLARVAQRCPSLALLDVSGCERVTDEGLAAVLTASAAPPLLCAPLPAQPQPPDTQASGYLPDRALRAHGEHLNAMRRCAASGCAGVRARWFLTSVGASGAGGPGSVALAVSWLRRVSLAGCVLVEDDAVAELCVSTGRTLERADFGGCARLTDRALATLARCCPRLVELSVAGCLRVTDDGALALSTGCVKGLERCDVSLTAVTDVGIAAVTEAFSSTLRELRAASPLDVDVLVAQRMNNRLACAGLEQRALMTLQVLQNEQVKRMGAWVVDELGEPAGSPSEESRERQQEAAPPPPQFERASGLQLQSVGLSGHILLQPHRIAALARRCAWSLLEMDLSHCELVDDLAVAAVARSCRSIYLLRLGGCPLVGDGAVLALLDSQLPLRELDLSFCEELLDRDGEGEEEGDEALDEALAAQSRRSGLALKLRPGSAPVGAARRKQRPQTAVRISTSNNSNNHDNNDEMSEGKRSSVGGKSAQADLLSDAVICRLLVESTQLVKLDLSFRRRFAFRARARAVSSTAPAPAPAPSASQLEVVSCTGCRALELGGIVELLRRHRHLRWLLLSKCPQLLAQTLSAALSAIAPTLLHAELGSNEFGLRVPASAECGRARAAALARLAVELAAACLLQRRFRRFRASAMTLEYMVLKHATYLAPFAERVQREFRRHRALCRFLAVVAQRRGARMMQRMVRAHNWRKAVRRMLKDDVLKRAREALAGELHRKHLAAKRVGSWFRFRFWLESPAGLEHRRLETEAKAELGWLRKQRAWRAVWELIRREVAERAALGLRFKRAHVSSVLSPPQHPKRALFSQQQAQQAQETSHGDWPPQQHGAPSSSLRSAAVEAAAAAAAAVAVADPEVRRRRSERAAANATGTAQPLATCSLCKSRRAQLWCALCMDVLCEGCCWDRGGRHAEHVRAREEPHNDPDLIRVVVGLEHAATAHAHDLSHEVDRARQLSKRIESALGPATTIIAARFSVIQELRHRFTRETAAKEASENIARKRRVARLQASAWTVQRCWRKTKFKRLIRDVLKHRVKLRATLERDRNNAAASKIQAAWRGREARLMWLAVGPALLADPRVPLAAKRAELDAVVEPHLRKLARRAARAALAKVAAMDREERELRDTFVDLVAKPQLLDAAEQLVSLACDAKDIASEIREVRLTHRRLRNANLSDDDRDGEAKAQGEGESEGEGEGEGQNERSGNKLGGSWMLDTLQARKENNLQKRDLVCQLEAHLLLLSGPLYRQRALRCEALAAVARDRLANVFDHIKRLEVIDSQLRARRIILGAALALAVPAPEQLQPQPQAAAEGGAAAAAAASEADGKARAAAAASEAKERAAAALAELYSKCRTPAVRALAASRAPAAWFETLQTVAQAELDWIAEKLGETSHAAIKAARTDKLAAQERSAKDAERDALQAKRMREAQGAEGRQEEEDHDDEQGDDSEEAEVAGEGGPGQEKDGDEVSDKRAPRPRSKSSKLGPVSAARRPARADSENPLAARVDVKYDDHNILAETERYWLEASELAAYEKQRLRELIDEERERQNAFKALTGLMRTNEAFLDELLTTAVRRATLKWRPGEWVRERADVPRAEGDELTRLTQQEVDVREKLAEVHRRMREATVSFLVLQRRLDRHLERFTRPSQEQQQPQQQRQRQERLAERSSAPAPAPGPSLVPRGGGSMSMRRGALAPPPAAVTYQASLPADLAVQHKLSLRVLSREVRYEAWTALLPPRFLTDPRRVARDMVLQQTLQSALNARVAEANGALEALNASQRAVDEAAQIRAVAQDAAAQAELDAQGGKLAAELLQEERGQDSLSGNKSRLARSALLGAPLAALGRLGDLLGVSPAAMRRRREAERETLERVERSVRTRQQSAINTFVGIAADLRLTVGQEECAAMEAEQRRLLAQELPFLVRLDKNMGVDKSIYLWLRRTQDLAEMVAELRLEHADVRNSLHRAAPSDDTDEYGTVQGAGAGLLGAAGDRHDSLAALLEARREGGGGADADNHVDDATDYVY
jgi:hypothetical protein